MVKSIMKVPLCDCDIVKVAHQRIRMSQYSVFCHNPRAFCHDPRVFYHEGRAQIPMARHVTILMSMSQLLTILRRIILFLSTFTAYSEPSFFDK